MKTRVAVRDIVRQFLRDETPPEIEHDFQNDELDLHLAECLIEISERSPYEEIVTVKSDGTRTVSLVDASGDPIAEDLLEVHKAEYPAGDYPPRYRDVERIGDTVRLKIATEPPSDEDIYLYCYRVHKLTDTESTLDPALEGVLIKGGVAKAALAWANEIRRQISEAVSATDTARMEASKADLVTGRTFINKINIGASPEGHYAQYAGREAGNAMAYLSASGAVTRYQGWANSQYLLYQAGLNQITKKRTWEFYPAT